jgi:hypothetical protein
MVPLAGFKPATPRFVAERSFSLSYKGSIHGTPGRDQTFDTEFRRLVLYFTELLGLKMVVEAGLEPAILVN